MQLRIFGAFAHILSVLVEYCSSGEDVSVNNFIILRNCAAILDQSTVLLATLGLFLLFKILLTLIEQLTDSFVYHYYF